MAKYFIPATMDSALLSIEATDDLWQNWQATKN